MKIQIWDINNNYDLAADRDFNFLCCKTYIEDCINIDAIKIGDTCFVPGNFYTKIGKSNKTCAAYIQIHIITPYSLKYVGEYKDYLLFRGCENEKLLEKDIEIKGKKYKDKYYTLKILNKNNLFMLNMANSGRTLEL